MSFLSRLFGKKDKSPVQDFNELAGKKIEDFETGEGVSSGPWYLTSNKVPVVVMPPAETVEIADIIALETENTTADASPVVEELIVEPVVEELIIVAEKPAKTKKITAKKAPAKKVAAKKTATKAKKDTTEKANKTTSKKEATKESKKKV